MAEAGQQNSSKWTIIAWHAEGQHNNTKRAVNGQSRGVNGQSRGVNGQSRGVNGQSREVNGQSRGLKGHRGFLCHKPTLVPQFQGTKDEGKIIFYWPLMYFYVLVGPNA